MLRRTWFSGEQGMLPERGYRLWDVERGLRALPRGRATNMLRALAYICSGCRSLLDLRT